MEKCIFMVNKFSFRGSNFANFSFSAALLSKDGAVSDEV